jgi:hypothetical protein
MPLKHGVDGEILLPESLRMNVLRLLCEALSQFRNAHARYHAMSYR